MTAHQTNATVSPVFARAASAWYFAEATIAAGKGIGLDGFRFYFLGRGGVLGDVDWRVVASAFGYFNPPLLSRMWTSALERCDRATAVAFHLSACEEFGRAHLADLPDAAAFCDAAGAAVEIAAADPGGLPLFAGYAAQPLPADPPARAIRLIAALRELRGSAHLAAVVATGLPTPVAHRIKRPGDVEMFGWKLDEVPEPTDDDRARMDEAERLTDQAVERVYRQLNDTRLDTLSAGAVAVAAVLGYE